MSVLLLLFAALYTYRLNMITNCYYNIKIGKIVNIQVRPLDVQGLGVR